MIKSKNISKKEVANILGVSESTVVRWSKYGDLPKPYLLGHNKQFGIEMKFIIG